MGAVILQLIRDKTLGRDCSETKISQTYIARALGRSSTDAIGDHCRSLRKSAILVIREENRGKMTDH